MSHLCCRATAAFVAVVVLIGCFEGHAFADDFQKSIQALQCVRTPEPYLALGVF